MKTENHTTGPWVYDPDEPNSHDIYSEGGYHIGRATACLGELGARSKANARLIAAAPDLLDALENLRDYVSDVANGHTLTMSKAENGTITLRPHIEMAKEDLARLDVAIAKAKGGEA